MGSATTTIQRSVVRTTAWLWVAGVALAAFGLAAFWLTANAAHQELRAVGHPAFTPFVLLIGWSFGASGIVAWHRRPDSAFGRLMVVVAVAWFVAALGASSDPVLFAVGRAITPLWLGVFIHALLAFPNGRLESRLSRLVVTAYYVDVVVLQMAWLAFADTRNAAGCAGCPENILLVADRPGLAQAFLILEQPIVGLLSLLGVLAVLALRWREATGPWRRVLAPVYASGGVCVALLILTIAVEPFSYEGGQIIGWVGGVAFTAVPLAFLAGLLRQQLTHASLGALLSELGESSQPSDVLGVLRHALQDPTLQIAYWSPAAQRFVDADGRGVDVPPDDGRHGVTVVTHGHDQVAALLHDPALHEDEQRIRTVCKAAGFALVNARLQADLRGRLEELKASRARILHAASAERRRLERDLHDGAQQRLLAVLLDLQRVTPATARADVDALIVSARTELARSLAELRELARGLHPAVLSDHGIAVALEDVVSRSTVPTTLDVERGQRLPAEVEAAAYFLVTEALTNIARHASAARATVRISTADGHAVVAVTDDGSGGADPSRGTGLRGMADRIAALDGRLEIDSPLGGPTTIRAVIPCAW